MAFLVDLGGIERPDTDLLYLTLLAVGDARLRFELNFSCFDSGALVFFAVYCLSTRPDVECVNVWFKLTCELYIGCLLISVAVLLRRGLLVS